MSKKTVTAGTKIAASESLAHAQLTRLESENLIRPLLDETDPAYIFKHTLTQETAYDAMLKTKRVELHRRVAEAIEKLAPDQLEQNAAVLAWHYERGGWDDLAFVYAALAGDVAWRAFAPSEAMSHYDRAIAIAKRVDSALFSPRAREVYSNRGRVFEVIGDRTAAIENYREMMDYAHRAHDAAMEAQALNHLVTVLTVNTGTLTLETDKMLQRALELARESGDQNLLGRTLWTTGLSRRFNEPARATEFFQQSLDLARTAGLKELAAYSLTELTVQSQIMGKWRAGLEYARRALEEFRAIDNKPMITDALANYGEILYMQGQIDAARAATTEGVDISRTMDNTWGIIFNRLILLFLDSDAGELESALRGCQEQVAAARRLGFPPFLGLNLMILARVYLELDQLELAQTCADECAALTGAMQVPLWGNLGNGVKGWALVRRGKFDQAHAILDDLWHEGRGNSVSTFSYQVAQLGITELALVDRRYEFGLVFCNWLIAQHESEDAWRLASDMYFLRGQIHSALDDVSAAERDLDRARVLAAKSNYHLILWRIDSALALLYAQRQEAERAREAFQRAASLLGSLAAKISEHKLRESFLGRKDVQQVLRTAHGK